MGQGLARYEVLNYVQKQKTQRKYFSAGMMESAEDFEFVDALHEARVLALKVAAALPVNSRNLLDRRYRDANSLQQVAVTKKPRQMRCTRPYSGSGRDCGSVST